MIIDTFVVLGGHKFLHPKQCAEYFNIPIAYVEHMLASDDYPGCQRWVVEDYISFAQTLAVMKSTDVTCLPDNC